MGAWRAGLSGGFGRVAWPEGLGRGADFDRGRVPRPGVSGCGPQRSPLANFPCVISLCLGGGLSGSASRSDYWGPGESSGLRLVAPGGGSLRCIDSGSEGVMSGWSRESGL
eukprot:3151218-Heterocapsa_arctica.AAC.1